jgi:hypothetical protein
MANAVTNRFMMIDTTLYAAEDQGRVRAYLARSRPLATRPPVASALGSGQVR